MHGATHFTRCLLAMHARHGLEIGLGFLGIAGKITVDTEPGHLTAAGHLVLADNGDIVLSLARNGARVAADAAVEVDHHSPSGLVARPRRIEAVLVRISFAKRRDRKSVV